jgi:amino-acid N-acetyltransferase
MPNPTPRNAPTIATKLPDAAPLDLRNASLEDIGRISALIKYWAERGRMLERSEELLQATIHEFLILELSDGTLAGVVGLHRMAEDLAEVRGLAIAPGFQGQGLGRWLVLGAERMARDCNAFSRSAVTTESLERKALCQPRFTLNAPAAHS